MREPIEDLQFARRLVESGTARIIREEAELSRGEFVQVAGNVFTPAALRAWESGRRRPKGVKGAAYGSALRRLVVG